jgi:large subunit ribosomal protein L21
VYAIVRAGGHQYRVGVGDELEIDRVSSAVGEKLELSPVMVVSDGKVTHDESALAATPVTAEVLAHTLGKKIKILKFKNKIGYRRRQGHRQRHTRVRVTSIGKGA